MTSTIQIITKAMQKAGVLVKSEVPDADEASDALSALNMMLSSWSNDSMNIYARVTESFPISANTIAYSIGTGQTFNTARPIFIVDATIQQGVLTYPMEPITDSGYADLLQKTLTGTPYFYNYDNNFPTGSIKLYPAPDQAYVLNLVSEKELSQVTLYQTISLPPGWERALVYNLAVEISPDYGQPVNQDTARIAAKSLAEIKRSVAKARSMDATPMVNNSRYNIYAGY